MVDLETDRQTDRNSQRETGRQKQTEREPMPKLTCTGSPKINIRASKDRGRVGDVTANTKLFYYLDRAPMTAEPPAVADFAGAWRTLRRESITNWYCHVPALLLHLLLLHGW